jgi:hypothetical protein
MKKSRTAAQSPARRRAEPRLSKRRVAANAAIACLARVQPKSRKGTRIAALLKSWLEDESGYDEKAFPRLKKGLNEQRDRVGARRLFDG